MVCFLKAKFIKKIIDNIRCIVTKRIENHENDIFENSSIQKLVIVET